VKPFDLLSRKFQVASVRGIPVRIDGRWLVVFALSVVVVALNFMRGTTTTRLVRVDEMAAWAIGIFTTLILFLSIFGHELAHALVARGEGIEIEEIMLHPFGGLARLRHEPDEPAAEFRIAIAGPASNFLFALLAFGAMSVMAIGRFYVAGAVFFIIGWWNLLIAVFNLLPGYPLDGGRLLRAFLWQRTGHLHEATRTACLAGQIIAAVLIIFGLYFYLRFGDPFMGLWAILVGLFLWDAARAALRGRLNAQTVADVMRPPFAIGPDLSISQFVDQVLPFHRQTIFPVARGGSLYGMLVLEDLKGLPRESWPRTRVREAMRPVEEKLFIEASAPLWRAAEIMRRNGIGALAVIDADGHLVGFLDHTQRRSSIKI
jgi:Zn-dependent protease